MEELAVGEREGGSGVLGSGKMSGSVTQWGLSYPRRGGRFSGPRGWDSVGSDVVPLCSVCLEEGPPGRGAAWQGLSKETAHQSFCPSRSLKREISDLPSHPII